MRKKEKRTAIATGALAVGALSGLFVLVNQMSVSAQTNQPDVVETTTEEFAIVPDILEELPSTPIVEMDVELPDEEADGNPEREVEDHADDRDILEDYVIEYSSDGTPSLYELSRTEISELIETHLQENFGDEIVDSINLIDAFYMSNDNFITVGGEAFHGATWDVMVLGESGVSVEELNPLDPILFFDDNYDYAIEYLQNFPLFNFTINALTGEFILFEDNREEVIAWSNLRAGQLQDLNPDLDFSDRDGIRDALN